MHMFIPWNKIIKIGRIVLAMWALYSLMFYRHTQILKILFYELWKTGMWYRKTGHIFKFTKPKLVKVTWPYTTHRKKFSFCRPVLFLHYKNHTFILTFTWQLILCIPIVPLGKASPWKQRGTSLCSRLCALLLVSLTVQQIVKQSTIKYTIVGFWKMILLRLKCNHDCKTSP